MGKKQADDIAKRDEKNRQYTEKLYTFPIREEAPTFFNKFYNNVWAGGISTAVTCSDTITNVLPNCAGWALGRFNEVYCQIKNLDVDSLPYGRFGSHNAGQEWIDVAKNCGLEVGDKAAPGAIMVWTESKPYAADGHVAFVERVNDDGSVYTSESGWPSFVFKNETRIRGYGFWGEVRSFLGFIYNPAVPEGAKNTNGSPYTDGSGNAFIENYISMKSPAETVSVNTLYNPYSWSIETTTSDEIVTRDIIETNTTSAHTLSGGANLLQYPSLIETPYVMLEIGDYVFGSYSKEGQNPAVVRYPNYINSMVVKKVNGTVNQYTIKIVYQIEFGADPNLLDKIFSSVGFGTVYISYGDWSSPGFIYKRESALITKITSKVDFNGSKIEYELKCTSNAVSLSATSYSFGAYNGKPSNLIMGILKNQIYGLKEVFPGMYKNGVLDEEKIMQNGWIATDDKAVEINPKQSIDPLSYLNYVVSCMVSSTNIDNGILQNSTYYMTIHDDGVSSYGGSYFKVSKVNTELKSLSSIDTYTIDVGFPDIKNNLNNVFSFNVSNENSWPLLYNYAEKLQNQEYVYKIDDNGNMYSEYSPGMATSISKYTMTTPQKTWWTQMTQFPLTVSITLKGIVRSTLLMEYIRINALFYGQKHVSSGLYVVTAQEDSISGNGYRTTLTLLRIAGDEDYISKATKVITKSIEQVKLTENTDKLTGVWEIKDKSGKIKSIGGYTNSYTDEDGNEIYVYTSKDSYKKAINESSEIIR